MNCKKKEVIPVWKEFPAEGFDPAGIYEKFRDKNSFLLESVHPDNIQAFPGNGSIPTDRYSFIGFDPYLIFKSKGEKIWIEKEGRVFLEDGNPFIKLKELISGFRMARRDTLPPFSGGALGYISYEARHFFERLPQNAADDLNLPDTYFVFIDKIIAFDHYRGKIVVICQARPGGYSLSEAERELERLCKRVFSEKKNENGVEKYETVRIFFQLNYTIDEFKSMVQAAKEYIKCGDIYQANLSQRLSIPIQGDPWQLYRILRNINPSPFASYLEFEDVTIVSSSPERLLAVRSDIVETRPIAGTRRRGNNISEDRKLSRGLILSPKERAEHIMLVDLERNDLGRFCRYGTVAANELMTLESYSHVIHIVSNVRGRLKAGKDRFDAIASCFPGGTITGTPKIRSMEIIDELEKVARSIYTGSIGYFNYGGEMDLNIVIRTFVITGGYAYVQVGAGIVADSDPEREYYETLHKAEALIKAVKSTNRVYAKTKPFAVV